MNCQRLLPTQTEWLPAKQAEKNAYVADTGLGERGDENGEKMTRRTLPTLRVKCQHESDLSLSLTQHESASLKSVSF